MSSSHIRKHAAIVMDQPQLRTAGFLEQSVHRGTCAHYYCVYVRLCHVSPPPARWSGMKIRAGAFGGAPGREEGAGQSPQRCLAGKQRRFGPATGLTPARPQWAVPSDIKHVSECLCCCSSAAASRSFRLHREGTQRLQRKCVAAAAGWRAYQRTPSPTPAPLRPSSAPPGA